MPENNPITRPGIAIEKSEQKSILRIEPTIHLFFFKRYNTQKVDRKTAELV